MGEIKVRLGDDKGGANSNDPEDPFADLILATRQKVGCYLVSTVGRYCTESRHVPNLTHGRRNFAAVFFSSDRWINGLSLCAPLV